MPTDYAKSAKEIIVDLINETNGSTLLAAVLNFPSPPTPVVEGEAAVTLTVAAVADAGYQGGLDIQYDRIDIDTVPGKRNVSKIVVTGPALTTHDMIPLVNQAYGINLTAADVVDAPLVFPTNDPEESVALTFAMTPGSLVYFGGISFVVRRGSIDLSTLTPVPLSGFEYTAPDGNGVAYFQDTFTGAGVELTDHVADVGAYVPADVAEFESVTIDADGKLTAAMIRIAAIPPTYVAEMNVVINDILNPASEAVYALTRKALDPTTDGRLVYADFSFFGSTGTIEMFVEFVDPDGGNSQDFSASIPLTKESFLARVEVYENSIVLLLDGVVHVEAALNSAAMAFLASEASPNLDLRADNYFNTGGLENLNIYEQNGTSPISGEPVVTYFHDTFTGAGDETRTPDVGEYATAYNSANNLTLTTNAEGQLTSADLMLQSNAGPVFTLETTFVVTSLDEGQSNFIYRRGPDATGFNSFNFEIGIYDGALYLYVFSQTEGAEEVLDLYTNEISIQAGGVYIARLDVYAGHVVLTLIEGDSPVVLIDSPLNAHAIDMLETSAYEHLSLVSVYEYLRLDDFKITSLLDEYTSAPGVLYFHDTFTGVGDRTRVPEVGQYSITDNETYNNQIETNAAGRLVSGGILLDIPNTPTFAVEVVMDVLELDAEANYFIFRRGKENPSTNMSFWLEAYFLDGNLVVSVYTETADSALNMNFNSSEIAYEVGEYLVRLEVYEAHFIVRLNGDVILDESLTPLAREILLKGAYSYVEVESAAGAVLASDLKVYEFTDLYAGARFSTVTYFRDNFVGDGAAVTTRTPAIGAYDEALTISESGSLTTVDGALTESIAAIAGVVSPGFKVRAVVLNPLQGAINTYGLFEIERLTVAGESNLKLRLNFVSPNEFSATIEFYNHLTDQDEIQQEVSSLSSVTALSYIVEFEVYPETAVIKIDGGAVLEVPLSAECQSFLGLASNMLLRVAGVDVGDISLGEIEVSQLEGLYTPKDAPLYDTFSGTGPLTGHLSDEGNVVWSDNSVNTGYGSLTLSGNGMVAMGSPGVIKENTAPTPGLVSNVMPVYVDFDFVVEDTPITGKFGLLLGNLSLEVLPETSEIVVYGDQVTEVRYPFIPGPATTVGVYMASGTDEIYVSVNGVEQAPFALGFTPVPPTELGGVTLRSLYLSGNAYVTSLRVGQVLYEAPPAPMEAVIVANDVDTPLVVTDPWVATGTLDYYGTVYFLWTPSTTGSVNINFQDSGFLQIFGSYADASTGNNAEFDGNIVAGNFGKAVTAGVPIYIRYQYTGAGGPTTIGVT